MFSLLWYLSRLSGASLAGSIVASLLAAGANLYLMSIIISAFKPTGNSPQQMLAFGLLCIVLLSTRALSQVLLIRVTQGTVYHLQVKLSRQVAAMEQDALETLGSIPVLSVLSDDVNTISVLGTQIPAMVMNVCIFVGVLSYVFHLSVGAFLMLVLMVVMSTIGYRLIARNTTSLMSNHRRHQEMVLQSVNALIHGSKELRLNTLKHQQLLTEIENHAARARAIGLSAWQRHSTAGAWVYTSYFLIVGVLLASPQLHIYGLDQRNAIDAVFGLLFMKGAIETIFAVIPTFGQAQVAFRRIEEIGLQLHKGEKETAHTELATPDPLADFKRIRMVNVEYAYSNQRGHFHLGPLSLDIHQGEVLFIAGGNGAGKTSLLKLVTGLYVPTNGHIEIDGLRIADTDIPGYRQACSAVFQEFQVFTRLSDPTSASVSRARNYLKEFQLDHCVGIDDTGFCSATLSRGQHKRLALIVALMEDKPILILDEWAADQDPQFRAYFYEHLIPQMRINRKTVIAVTHDDGWYYVADRVLWLSEGILTLKTQLRDVATASAGTSVLSTGGFSNARRGVEDMSVQHD